MGGLFPWMRRPAPEAAPGSLGGWRPAGPPGGPTGAPPNTASGVQPPPPTATQAPGPAKAFTHPYVIIPPSPDLRYDRCFRFTEREEGGIADRPPHEDPGGVTNRGVSLRFARSLGTSFDLDGDGDVDRDDILRVKPEHALWAFREVFWRPCRGDDLWAGLDLMAFDCAVHSGTNRATRIMQAALGQEADGIIGPRTMGAVALAASVAQRAAIIDRYAALRGDFLRGLKNARSNPGWWPRVERARLLARRWVEEAR